MRMASGADDSHRIFTDRPRYLHQHGPRTGPGRAAGLQKQFSVAEGVRLVGELAEQTRYDESNLLAHVHRVVADALKRACYEDHVHRPLARIGVVADLESRTENLAVEAIDLTVLAREVFGEADVAFAKCSLALHDLRARIGAHLQD